MGEISDHKKSSLAWRIFRAMLFMAVALASIPVCIVFAFRLSHDFENKPLCHKAAWAMCEHWLSHKRPQELPNLQGNSADSLARLVKEVAGKDEGDDDQEANDWTDKYQYVPGLRRGDPGDLVVMYLKRPTRWQHHAAAPPWIFREAKWVVVPLDFVSTLGPDLVTPVNRQVTDEGECAERVSQAEFEARLRKTLQFLKENNRPHWETVFAENEAFLKALESETSAN
jgi:hypothetical protein